MTGFKPLTGEFVNEEEGDELPPPRTNKGGQWYD
jgi:hypothetical protein